MSSIISIIVVIGVCLVVKDFFTKKNKSHYKNSEWPLNLSDSTVQLKLISRDNIEFKTQKIMQHEEYNVFNIIEKDIIPSFSGCRVFAQVSLGEILKSTNKQAYMCINSKRVDILIIDKFGSPLVAVEYQGKGHYQNDAAARTAVKKEALRKAGVGHIEIFPEHNKEDIKHLVSRALECKLNIYKDKHNVIDLPTALL